MLRWQRWRWAPDPQTSRRALATTGRRSSWFMARSSMDPAGRVFIASCAMTASRSSSFRIPTTSLADDVAVTRRAIAAAEGNVILVGHSYGGVVITEAGTDPKVSALVYIAAFAPDQGESVSSLNANAPPGAPALADPSTG